MNKELQKYTLDKNSTIIDALRKIDGCVDDGVFTVFVIDDDCRVIGSLTDGDIRRALIGGASVNDNVSGVMCRDFHYLSNIDDYDQVKKFKSSDIKLVPLVSEDMKVINFINLKNIRAILPLDVVIMAGGKGIRLKPYTDNVPKPMLDLNGKPMIAHNIDRLMKYGVKNFYISVNHMKECIREYLDNRYPHVNIRYIEEDKPLGTVGSVKLVKDFAHGDILVMNADILTNINFDDFYGYYKKVEADMLIATFNTKTDIPYAVLEVNNHRVESFVEKPTYAYHSSAGIYLINAKYIDLIPNNEFFDVTDFIKSMLEKNKHVGYFPIMGYWLDIGSAQNYNKAREDVRYVRF
ncbi:MAG: nucleotidyltransferase family protein [Holosporaceae bacterium]|jgi:dTDP-glucose pyrophosphorylase|nr:nucleotidyltransferase family protein [Holosporaceae bacterium]